MTEPKKVALTTLGPVKKEKKRDRRLKSVRLNLTLAESNEKFCPEFNYRELVSLKLHERLGKKRLGDVINGPALDPSDPFAGDEDAALKALAKQMESKYASYGPTKKKRRKENDFSTLGEGYDETDPFIDNSDAFDEVVPTHMETKHRGFYINSGELDFEEVAHESLEEDSILSDIDAGRKKVVKRIESDPEEEGEEEGEESNKGEAVYENGVIRPKKRKLDEGELLRKRKKMIGKFNAKNLEKKDSDPEMDKIMNGCENKGDIALNDQSIAASIEAVISKAREEAVDKKSDTQESASGSDSSSSDSDSSGSSSSSDSDSDEEDEGEEKDGENEGDGEEETEGQELEENGQNPENVDDIPLPNNLPPDLIQLLDKLKEEGHACKLSSQKFFTDDVNKLLLSIVIKLNKLGVRKKTQIYNHLSQHLPCGTQTIVKRAKNLLTEKQENRIQEPIYKLKVAIDEVMPTMIKQHALECQKAVESNPHQYWELYYHFWGENGSAPIEEEEEDGDKKKCKLPKKKFIFTDEVRNCLCDVVRIRVQFWHLIRKRCESPEDHIRTFLDTEIRPLWPKGWMNARILYKESYAVHAVLTGGGRPKTPVKKGSLDAGTLSSVSTSVITQPPKPSLSATVIPKNHSPHVSSSPKSEILKKKPPANEQKTNIRLSVEGSLPPPLAPSSGGLSIKSVEKINEGASRIVQSTSVVAESSISKERTKTESSKTSSVEESASKVSHEEKLTSKKDDVSVIDLSSDEDRTDLKAKLDLIASSKSSDLKQEETVEEKESFAVSSTSSVTSNVTSSELCELEVKKEDNLEEEMNLVMNELLQISKQKSVDGYPDKLTSAKDNIPSSTVITKASKDPNDIKLQVQNQLQQKISHSSAPIQTEKFSQKPSTSAVHSDKYSHKASASSVQADKYSQKHHSTSPTYSSQTSPGRNQRPGQHSSPVQEQKSSHPPVDHKQHHTSPADPLKQQSQPSPSSAHHKSHSSVQPNSSIQSHSSPHLPKDAHQPKSMQQSQSHHHSSINLQKGSSQQSLGISYSSQSQPMKPVSDSSHKKLSSQQFPQSHHSQSVQQKSINVSVSSWTKPEASLSSKHSSESTKKTHTSWASSSDVSVARQKHQDDIQVVTPVDPLANLRMMHGLSVSNVNKKNSGSSSVYHSPVLATAATTYNPTSSVNVSGSNNSNINSVSSSLTQSITSSSPQNQTKTSGYSSSQAKHSSSSASHSSSKSSKHSSNSKPRLDQYSGGVTQSMYNSLASSVYKQQLQQKQANHLTAQQQQQQQELWQQISASNYLPGIGPLQGQLSSEMMKLVSHVGKSVDSFSPSGPYPNPGTPTSVSSHLSPYGDASRGNQHSHHISPHHLHPTHGGSEQHRGQY
ncbi:ubinuclein-1 isoform X3 [Palaemon carinicauda]|uniref:ubinuclein-1 isoform X3 n=1 Tax=Palaemon carinicauda TaxID=392227 RepID=UPI0035B59C46